MKNNKFIVLVALILFALFVSGCADPGANQSEKQGATQGDETSKSIGNAINYGNGVQVPWNGTLQFPSAWYFSKLNKAGSNLSWAAAARMAVISQRYRWDKNIVNDAWQGDMSAHFYSGWRNNKPYDNSNAKPFSYFDMIETIKSAIDYYGDGYPHGGKLVPNGEDVFSDRFHEILHCGVPIIVVRRDKTNYNDFWAVVIYAMPDTTDGHETISVWDPEHGWDYTCDLKGFCDDARYYDNDKIGQYAIWPIYGPYAVTAIQEEAYTPKGF